MDFDVAGDSTARRSRSDEGTRRRNADCLSPSNPTGILLMCYRTLICVVALWSFPGLVCASDVNFAQNFVANFEFDVLGGTPINPGPATGFQPYEAVGALNFTLDSSLNDPSHPTTVPFTNVTGTLNGVFPASLLPYTISPDVQFLSGDLTNIVRNGSGDVISGDVSNLSMRWDLIAFGGGLTLFTLDGLPFNGSITSLPFSYGTLLSGAAPFNVYLDAGGTDVLVAIGQDRTLAAVPEPSSVTLAGLAALTVGACMARRRR
jgi:PEP-CTERM motif